MTLEQAIEVLNERRHLRSSDWRIDTHPDHVPSLNDDSLVVEGNEGAAVFTMFEAIAIAEAYVREAGK